MKLILKKVTLTPSTKIIANIGLGKGGKVQAFLDNEAAKHLRKYVSKKTGTQEGLTQPYGFGNGLIVINVPYAAYQAYSPRITKRKGQRGTKPFERMKADKKDVILRDTAKYAKGVSK